MLAGVIKVLTNLSNNIAMKNNPFLFIVGFLAGMICMSLIIRFTSSPNKLSGCEHKPEPIRIHGGGSWKRLKDPNPRTGIYENQYDMIILADTLTNHK